MGNNQSSDSRKAAPQSPHTHSHAQSPSSASQQHQQHPRTSHDLHHTTSRTYRDPRRRESISIGAALAEKVGKAAPVAPSASTATAELFKSSSTHSSGTREAGSGGSGIGHPEAGITRIATGGSASGSRVHHTTSRSEASIPVPLQKDESGMGNEQSRPVTAREPRDGGKESGSSLSRQTTRETPPPLQTKQRAPEQPVGPVNVPSGHADHGHRDEAMPLSPLSPMSPGQSASYSVPVSAGFSRPPRLPLPIGEEEYIPGSPVLSPAELQDPVEALDDAGRTRSMLSGTTVDDDVEDLEEGGLIGEAQGPSVPTLIEWRGPGERVYVTGTFAAWDRKYRLHKDGPSKHKGALSVTINLQPGTHHLKFIVDDDMKLSDQLPTAVDYTNILVNYIEVSADDRPAQPTSAIQAPGPPVIPPGTEPVLIKPPPAAVMQSVTKTQIPSHIRPPQILPPTPELQEAIARPQTPAKSSTTATETGEKPPTKTSSGRTEPRSERMATKYYHNVVPKFLLDGDLPEDTLAHRNADAVCDTLPTPPTLPLFLSKSVLNGAMPMKDDASVLIMPNHTVLNHLATSSIRGGTLATSATTRYRNKFLTTIIYKPTADYGD